MTHVPETSIIYAAENWLGFLAQIFCSIMNLKEKKIYMAKNKHG